MILLLLELSKLLVLLDWKNEMKEIEIGKGEMLKDLTATTSVPALELRISEQEYLIETQKKVIRLYEKLEKTANQ